MQGICLRHFAVHTVGDEITAITAEANTHYLLHHKDCAHLGVFYRVVTIHTWTNNSVMCLYN